MSQSDAGAAFLDALRAALPDLRLSVEASVLEAHRRDETAYLEPPSPLAVAFPADTAEVAAHRPARRRPPRSPRSPRRRDEPVGRRRRRRGWPDGLAHADEPGPRDRRGEPRRRRAAGRGQRGPQEGRRRARALLCPGPGELRDLHDRRQPCHQLGRALLRQVRGHPRRRPRASRSCWRTGRSFAPAAATSRTSRATTWRACSSAAWARSAS